MLALMAALVGASSVRAQTTETSTVEEVVVTGQRASDKASLDKKRAADTSTEVVSANDVGKLPDQNVAEAVRRLTGVSVATDKGEGRYLIIRGIEPNLANVTINNQTASAPEPSDRNVKLDDIPSALIGSVTVVKSLTPNLDANAIAGQVDINTVSAFDRNRTFGSARVIGGTYNDGDRTSKEGDLAVGSVFGPDRQFGLVVAGNYSKRPSYSEDVLSTSRQLVNNIDLPAEMDMRIYDPAYRTRKGAVANFDWRPKEGVNLFARVMYAQFNDKESRNRFRLFFPVDNNAADTVTLPPGYSALSASGGTINSTTARRLFRQREETTSTTTYSVGGDFLFGPGKLTVQGTFASSKKNDPSRDEVEYRAAASTGVGATYVLTSGMPTSFTANAAALNPANYRLSSYKQAFRSAGEDLSQLRVDYQFPMTALGEDSTVAVGAKYLKRARFSDQTGRTFSAVSATAGTRTVATDPGSPTDFIYDGAYTFGPTINFDAIKTFVLANGLNTTQFTVNANDQISQSKTGDYEVNETVTAAYVMATIRHDKWTVIPGVRMERTEGDTKAIIYQAGVTTLTTPFNNFGSYSYTDYFPSLNIKYQATDNLIVRAAVTTALGRPPFADLAPTVTVDTGSNTVSQGNPNLQAQHSLNFDFSLEYYFPHEGGMSVAVFRKQIDNPIFSTTATNQTGTFGGVALVNATVSSFGNGDKAELTGIEFAFQKPLTFLPSPFDGLGVNANMTFTTSKLTVPGRTVDTPMVGQADRIASVQVYYEKYGVSARVAYTYHSAYLDTDGGLNVADPTGGGDGYFGALSTVDARVAYRFNRSIEVFVEGNNLNDAKDYYFFQNASRFREGEKYGASYRLGLSLTY